MQRKGLFRKKARGAGILIGGWLLITLLVCYPNPLIFFRNFYRYWRFPIDPAAVAGLPAPAGATGAQLEAFVLNRVRYQYDWPHYRVPWYVPTPVEVLSDNRGDC
ncbi:MAG: hypothetical protein C4321_08660, partial [Chloroflexota bacterium]